MEVFRMEIEQAETSSVERSQIRHGRSRSHFARQKISAEDSAAKDNADAVNRIKTSVRVDRENHFKTRQAEKVSDFPETSISHKHNHSWLLERNFSKDNSVNSQSFDRVEDNVPEGLESLLKLYQARKGSAPEESSAVPLTRNLSRLIEQNFSKDNSRNGGFSDQIGDEAWRNSKVDTLRARHSENHGVLRSSPDPLKSLFKDDPLSKLRKAMFLNKTVVSTAAIDRNTNETLGIDTAEANTSETIRDLEEEEVLQDVVMDYPDYEESANITFLDRSARRRPHAIQVDIVTRFLRIIENQHTLGDNCTAGTDLNLGEGVVDQYAQERFRLEAEFAVNRANMLTRLWKYAPEVMLSSEYLLHASVLSMVEFDEDIFAAGNCYDKLQYRNRWLYCPFAHRLPNQDGILVKDLAIQYKYLSNSSEWFYIARKNAERVIASYEQFSRGVEQVDNKTGTDVRECLRATLQQPCTLDSSQLV
ncbi:putative g-protein coupled receptor 158-like protein [Lasius niger]|uniref:Putative g-protein coupled receptor 158-like protein n=1 Tax=Lasius niger TaxID=67767 RepID=A0A0J7L980_LASNI|nr:putative g-protein coupled receptor 158-like protein [Lasius niger]